MTEQFLPGRKAASSAPFAASVPGAAWPLRVFAALAVPAASWQVWIFTAVPNYYAQHFFIYPAVLFMVWAWLQGLWSLTEARAAVRPFLPWLLLLVFMQIVAGIQSARLYTPEGASALAAVAANLGKLCVQLPFLLFFALLGRVLMRSAHARRLLLCGALWTFAALFFWFGVQAAQVYTTPSLNGAYLPANAGLSPFIAALREVARALLTAVAPFLEARWPDAIYDFYGAGAYSLQLPRCNGFFEEASALAAMLAVFFIPLSFGLVGVGRACRSSALLAGGILLTIGNATMLLFCRSVTGTLLAAVTGALLLFGILPTRFKRITAGLAALALTLCVVTVSVLFQGSAPQGLTSVVDKFRGWEQGASPRIVSMLDTLNIIEEHPWVGVGRGWYFAHLHQGAYWRAHQDKDMELRTWAERGSGGELSALPALAAQYGLPLTAAAVLFALHILRRLYALRRQQPQNMLLQFCAPACAAWTVLGFITLLALLDVRNALFLMPFFCFYAVSQGAGCSGETSGASKLGRQP